MVTKWYIEFLPGPNSKRARCPIFKFFVVTREVICRKMAPILELVNFFWVFSLLSHCEVSLSETNIMLDPIKEEPDTKCDEGDKRNLHSRRSIQHQMIIMPWLLILRNRSRAWWKEVQIWFEMEKKNKFTARYARSVERSKKKRDKKAH